MVKQIDKAFHDYEEYGIDPDEIMVLDQEELDQMYDGEVEAPNIEEVPAVDEYTSLKIELQKKENELKELNKVINELVLHEIPECEEYLDNVDTSYERTEARNDLSSAKKRLNSALEKKKLLESAILAISEKMRRLEAEEMAMYDAPEEFTRETLEIELAEIENRLKSIFQELAENDKLKDESKDHYQRIELDQDNRDLNFEKNKLMDRSKKINDMLNAFGNKGR